MGKLSFLWEAEGNVDLMLSYSFQCSKKFRMGAFFKMLYMIGSLEASTKIVKAWFITSNSGSDCIVITRKNSINNKMLASMDSEDKKAVRRKQITETVLCELMDIRRDRL